MGRGKTAEGGKAGTVWPLPRSLLGMLRSHTVPFTGQYVRTPSIGAGATHPSRPAAPPHARPRGEPGAIGPADGYHSCQPAPSRTGAPSSCACRSCGTAREYTGLGARGDKSRASAQRGTGVGAGRRTRETGAGRERSPPAPTGADLIPGAVPRIRTGPRCRRGCRASRGRRSGRWAAPPARNRLRRNWSNDSRSGRPNSA